MPERLFHLGQCLHLLTIKGRLMLIGQMVVWQEVLFRNLLRRIQRRREGFTVMVGIARMTQQLLDIEHVVEPEINVFAGKKRHGKYSITWAKGGHQDNNSRLLFSHATHSALIVIYDCLMVIYDTWTPYDSGLHPRI